jgi:hypothetical protein
MTAAPGRLKEVKVAAVQEGKESGSSRHEAQVQFKGTQG